jgi:RNA polymerase sigma-70 factor (ECF subfamily)
MGSHASGDSSATVRLIERAVGGEPAPLGELLERHRARLRRMVALRLDPRLRGRVDPSDVIQESLLEAAQRLADFTRESTLPFFLWLRLVTGRRLQIVHRHHLGVRARDAAREAIAFPGQGVPEATSACLAAHLLGRDTRPSEVAERAERKQRLHEALDAMDPIDREVLALRHFERLTKAEAAQVLGISQAAVAQRHFRALERLKVILAGMPGGLEEFRP